MRGEDVRVHTLPQVGNLAQAVGPHAAVVGAEHLGRELRLPVVDQVHSAKGALAEQADHVEPSALQERWPLDAVHGPRRVGAQRVHGRGGAPRDRRFARWLLLAARATVAAGHIGTSGRINPLRSDGHGPDHHHPGGHCPGHCPGHHRSPGTPAPRVTTQPVTGPCNASAMSRLAL